jgi:O-antigen/teichoic acid export membrane protein
MSVSLARILSDHFSPGSFLRNLTILASGTVLAQALPVLASPILTRLYSPQDFAMLAIFMAMVNMFAPIVCGKYEVAMILPKSRVHAHHLLGIALAFSFAVSVLLALVFLFAGNDIAELLDAGTLGRWIFAVPMGLLLTGLFTALSYYANRCGHYRLMSRARIIRSLFMVLLSLLAGVAGMGFAGMLTGFFAGTVIAVSLLAYENRNAFGADVWRLGRAKKWLFCKYRQYPIYNASTGLLDGFTLGLPVFVLSRYYPDDIVGYYALVIRVLVSPVGFISASVSQINLKKVVDIINCGNSPLPYLRKVAALLLSIIFFPSLIIIGWGPELFSMLFGHQWIVAGEYARILMPAFMIQFVASTLSPTLEATKHIRLLALWKIISFMTTATICFLFAPRGDVKLLLYAFSINNIGLYLLYLIFIGYAAMKPKQLFRDSPMQKLKV